MWSTTCWTLDLVDIREDVRKREIADLRNQLLVHSRPERLEGGEARGCGKIAQSSL